MLLGENFNDKGESHWSNDQLLVQICSACERTQVANAITTPFLYDLDSWYASLGEFSEEAELNIAEEMNRYADGIFRYLRQSFGKYVVAVGGRHYKITDPRDAEGYWVYRLPHISPLVEGSLKSEYQLEV